MKLFGIEFCQTIASALSGGSFQIVEVAGLLLIPHDPLSKGGEGSKGKSLTGIGGETLLWPEEIEAGFVHTHHPDRTEVIRPEGPLSLPYTTEPACTEWIHAPLGLPFHDLPFQLETLTGEVGLSEHSLDEILLIVGKIGHSRQVDSDHADRSGERIRPEQA